MENAKKFETKNTTKDFVPPPVELASEQKPFEQPLAEVGELVKGMQKLLVKGETAIEHDQNLKKEMETLERWIESYRRGLSAANKITTAGCDIVKDIKDRLKLAIDEMQRLEDDGGQTADRKDAAKLDELTKTLRALEKLIPSIENTFGSALEAKDESSCEETKKETH